MELSKWCTILPDRSIPNYIILHICKRTFGSYKSLWPFEENKTSDTEHTSQLPWSRCLMTKTLNCSLSRRFIHARFMLKGSSLNKGKGIFSKTPWTWCKPQRSVLHLTEWLLLRLRTWESSDCFLITHVWFGPLSRWRRLASNDTKLLELSISPSNWALAQDGGVPCQMQQRSPINRSEPLPVSQWRCSSFPSFSSKDVLVELL